MITRRPAVLQVSAWDVSGGAEQMARELLAGCERAGVDCWHATAYQSDPGPRTLDIGAGSRAMGWQRALHGLGKLDATWAQRAPRVWRLSRLLHAAAQPGNLRAMQRGYEPMEFPASWELLSLPPRRPDVLHVHGLHGAYFDPRALPHYGDQLPVLLTLHDSWSMTGHCAAPIDCGRWEHGCGQCPDLDLYPAVKVDATAENWQRKSAIWKRCQLHIAAPSEFMLERARRSMLAPAIRSSRVIHNGVDLGVFRPMDRAVARQALELPADAAIVLFAASDATRNPFKDYATALRAVQQATRTHGGRVVFAVVGAQTVANARGEIQQQGGVEVHLLPFERDRGRMALHYGAADVYLHAAHTESWGLTVTEAMACGTPVIASSVGALPEQVTEGAEGFLTSAGDANAMAAALHRILSDRTLAAELGARAAKRGSQLGSQTMVDRYLDYYAELAAHRGSNHE